MGKEIMALDYAEVEKHKFHQHKNPISINGVDIDEIIVPIKFPFGKKGFKYLLSYKHVFFDKNNELLENYNEIWEKASNRMKKGFHSEPVYNGKYIKTKIKSYEEKINTNFYGDKVPKEGSQHICLSVILIGSVFRTEKKLLSKSVFRRM